MCQIAEVSYYKKLEKTAKFWQDKKNCLDKEYFWYNAGDKSTIWSQKNDGILNYPVSYVMPIQQDFFYDIMINVPSKSSELCTELFGEHFMSQDSKNNVRYAFENGYELESISDFSPFN